MVEPVPFAVDQRLGAKWDGHVETAAHFDAKEAGLGDADDLHRVAIERDLPANDRWVAAERASPERVADDGARRAATALVVGAREDATQRWLHAEDVEGISPHPPPVFGKALLAARGQIEGRRPPGEDTVKGLLLLPKLFPERMGQFRPPPIEISPTIAWFSDSYLGQLLRVLHR